MSARRAISRTGRSRPSVANAARATSTMWPRLCSASVRRFRVYVFRAPHTCRYPDQTFLFSSYRKGPQVREGLVFAVQFDRFGPPEVLSIGPFPEPHACPGQVRVRVRAAGVSPVDLALRAGGSPSAERLALPHIPGGDAAGVVDEVGADVTGVALEDEVFGSVDVARLGGASAEFAVLAFWAAKPAEMPWEEAGAAGTSIETAPRVLDLLDVHEGTTLLVDGAAGGVGSVAVRLAIARGAQVIGTGRPENQGFIARLGANFLL